MELELRVSASADAARRGAAELLAEAAEGGGYVAVSGGSTPGPAYELAATLEPDWSRSELWFADERCVDPLDERSNYRLVRERLVERLERGPAVEHRIRGELAAERAADEYERELQGVVLDLVLLGIGADGHTASLFPNDPALGEESRRAVAVRRPDVDRVTLTLPVLRGASTVIFLAVGADKADAVRRAFAEPPSPETPAGLVRSSGGITYAFLDREAAGALEN
ncbi:MAG TPA: 6-phosphogluconolactonase [Gaiellaceae bacterium]|nr:6-phosphogluconolactonase [Gaiellaceae bacterium]